MLSESILAAIRISPLLAGTFPDASAVLFVARNTLHRARNTFNVMPCCVKNGQGTSWTARSRNNLSVIDTRSLKVLKTITVGVRPRDLAFTPDSEIADVFGEGDASLTRVPIPGGAPVTRVLQLGKTARPMEVVFDAAQRRIYMTTGHGGRHSRRRAGGRC